MGIISPKEAQARAGKDYVRGNRFDVTMGGALACGSNVLDHCMSAVIPGTKYGTIDYRNASPVLKMPNDVIYNEFRLSFYNSSDGAALKHFQECNTTKIITDVKNDYSFNFFSDYTGDVTIKQYSPQNKLTQTVTMVNSWVVGIEDIVLSMENSNVVQIFHVAFNYEYPEHK